MKSLGASDKTVGVLPFVALTLLAAIAAKAVAIVAGQGGAFAQSASEASPAPFIDDAPEPTPANPVKARLEKRMVERERVLLERERNIETREQVLKVIEDRLDQKSATLRADIAKLEALKRDQENRKNEEFVSLAKAYERMRARDAARIFEVLEDDILVPVAAGMRTQALAGVLAEMQPQKAEALTRNLASYKAGAEARVTSQ